MKKQVDSIRCPVDRVPHFYVRVQNGTRFKLSCLSCGEIKEPNFVIPKPIQRTNFKHMTNEAIENWYMTEFEAQNK